MATGCNMLHSQGPGEHLRVKARIKLVASTLNPTLVTPTPLSPPLPRLTLSLLLVTLVISESLPPPPRNLKPPPPLRYLSFFLSFFFRSLLIWIFIWCVFILYAEIIYSLQFGPPPPLSVCFRIVILSFTHSVFESWFYHLLIHARV